MAHYYGTVQGGRGTASRLGHKTSGLVTTARTWTHTVTVALHYDEASGRDECSVCISANDGSKIRSIYSGFLDGMAASIPVTDVPVMEPVFTLQEIEAAKEEIAGK